MMDDVISRQAAIDAINTAFDRVFKWDGTPTLGEKVLKDVPSAEPERKKGQWIPVTNGRGGFECDQCHNYSPAYRSGDDYLSDYCPVCGSYNRGEKDGR